MDTDNIQTVILNKKFNRHIILDFLNKYHVTTTGNKTMFSEDNYYLFMNNGAVCSYLRENNKLAGCVLSILLTLNICKSSYTTFLCLKPSERGVGNARRLIETNIKFGATYLQINHGYYLGDVSRREGISVNSWYRIIKIDQMKLAGFDMVQDRKRALLKYNCRKLQNTAAKPGILTDDIYDSSNTIYWKPSEKEMRVFNEYGETYTVYKDSQETAIFILFPIFCTIGATSKTVKLAMVTYFYSFAGKTSENFKAMISTAHHSSYDGLYGYTIGQLSNDLVVENGGHISDHNYYLDFYNQKELPSKDKINVPLF